MTAKRLFDDWPERYDQWFTTPSGRLVRQFEADLIDELLLPKPNEKILDAGCGTGIFTRDFLAAGAEVVGLEISAPMLHTAFKKARGLPFAGVQGDMRQLPLGNDAFDKAVSITALEFIADATRAVQELFRVTRPGGRVVVATLNSLSPWAERRKAKTRSGRRHILEKAWFRSPQELLRLGPAGGLAKTAVHFAKDDPPDQAVETETRGRALGLDTGAFVAVAWTKGKERSR